MMNDKYHEAIDYNDGGYTYILNAKSRDQAIPSDLKEFLNYVATGKPSETGLTAEMQRYVEFLNKEEHWRDTMSTFEQIKDNMRKEGREEGLSEGLKATVELLSPFYNDVESLWNALKNNPAYKSVSKETVEKILKSK